MIVLKWMIVLVALAVLAFVVIMNAAIDGVLMLIDREKRVWRG